MPILWYIHCPLPKPQQPQVLPHLVMLGIIHFIHYMNNAMLTFLVGMILMRLFRISFALNEMKELQQPTPIAYSYEHLKGK